MRKQILIFGHNDAPQFIDIYNQYTRLFDPAHYEITVVYLTGEASIDTQNKTLADHCLFLNSPKKDIRNLKLGAIRQMLTLSREKRFDLVICHRYKPTYIMLWVNQFCRLRAMISVMHELGTMRSIKRQLTLAALAPKNMIFAGVSDAVRNDMRKDLWCIPNKRIITLYNMVDIALTEPQLYSRDEARKKLGLSATDFIFGNLGRLVKNKDQATLIKAFAAIKPNCPNAKLILIGKGELETALKSLASSYGLQNDIIFTGFLPNGFRYMKAFDCFVLSSIQEAFGRVLLEAMVARVPIIATRVHGIPEVVGELNCLVEPHDPAALAAAMRDIFHSTNEIREQLGEQGYAHVVNQFSIPVFQRQFSQIAALSFLPIINFDRA